MKCRETQYWLYSFQPNAAWPADVVGHLQGCAECQQVQTRLRAIDQQVNQLTSVPGNDSPKLELLKRIAATPQEAVAKEIVLKPRLPWMRYGAYLSGAAAMIAIGWLLGRQDEPTIAPIEIVREKLVEVVREKTITVLTHTDRPLIVSLLKRNARLVQSGDVKDRLETLLDMADDCRQHALTLIDQGPRDQLPLTIDLFGYLLHDGVLVQLSQAPMDTRPALSTAVRSRVQKMAEPAETGAKSLPRVLQDQRDALRNTAKETLATAHQIEEGGPPVKGRKWQRFENAPPTLALVQFALAVTSDADAVVRADECANCVQRLMPFVMLYLAEDTMRERAEMGQQFGEMIQFGIYRPLESATSKDPPVPVRELAERVVKNVDQTFMEIEKNWEQAPEAGKAGLERALEASWKGWQKNKGKGKGPPGLRERNDAPDKKSSGKGKSGQPKKQPGAQPPALSSPFGFLAPRQSFQSPAQTCRAPRSIAPSPRLSHV